MKTLLDIAYATMGERPAIQLFYKEKSGNGERRTVEEVTDFEPYFYATGDESLPGELKGLGKVVSVEKKRMTYLKEDVDVFRIAVSSPSDVPELRERAKKLPGCFGIFEADIPFVRRYMIDSQLTPMENAEDIGLNIAAFDLEVYNALGEPKAERDPIICLSYADSGGARKVFTYRNLEINEDYLEILENEAAVIKRFVELIKSRGIDIIVSYNADNFDFPYIIERANQLKLPLPLGIDGSDVRMERRGMNMGAKVRGRPHVDMYPVCRGAFNLPRYTLEDVYKGLFGKEKLDIDGMRIHEYWDSKDPKVLKELFDYSLSDVVATLEIANRVLPLQYEMSRIVREPIYEVSRMGSGQKVEQLLIENAFRQNMLVPNKPHEGDVKLREAKSYVGGYVVEPKRGIHDNISLFDFRSLYPSVIISHNIDPATIDCKCCKAGHKAPTGHFFCMDKKGFIPGIIEGLVKKRVAIKKRLRETEDQKEKLVLGVQQEAVKILTNSFYGYLAFARARWYSKECAEATSAFGRQYIHKTVKSANDAGFEVVYGDSLPYDRYIFIKFKNEDIMLVKIGELYDKYKDIDGISTLAMDKNKKVVFKPIKRVIRHEYNGKLLKIITRYGSTIVTPQHSVYSFNDKTKDVYLVDANKLEKGDKLISLTNQEIVVKYKEGHIFDMVDMDIGGYTKELMLYSDKLIVPAQKGECHYCKKEVNLAAHVFAKHPERREKFDKKSLFSWAGGEQGKIRKIPRYWNFDKDLAWLLGFYCAEGSVSDVLTKSGRKCLLSFGGQNRELIKHVKSILDIKTGTSTKIIKNYDSRNKRYMYYYRTQCLPIIALFQYGFGAGKGSEFKKVPWFIFNAEESLRKAFVEGYLDGDGTKKDKRYVTNFIEFSTKSKELAMGLDFLLKTLSHGKNYFGKDIKHVAWKYRKDKPEIQALRLQSAKDSKGNFCLAEIHSMEEMPNEKYVYDLEVDDTHNFVDAEGMILVHNTDSIFITMEETDSEKIKKRSIEFMKGINRELPETMELEFEGFYPRGIFITKKRYALMNEDGEMIVKGLETRRRDWANVAKHTQQKVLYTILHEKNPQKAAHIVKEMVQKIKGGGVEMEDLVINTRLTQSIKSYKNVGPHVMAVMKAKERGIDIKEGDVVPYIITKKGASISDRAVLANLAEKGDYDPDYYINNQVLPAVMRVLEALGYSEQELKGLGKQMSLWDF